MQPPPICIGIVSPFLSLSEDHILHKPFPNLMAFTINCSNAGTMPSHIKFLIPVPEQYRKPLLDITIEPLIYGILQSPNSWNGDTWSWLSRQTMTYHLACLRWRLGGPAWMGDGREMRRTRSGDKYVLLILSRWR